MGMQGFWWGWMVAVVICRLVPVLQSQNTGNRNLECSKEDIRTLQDFEAGFNPKIEGWPTSNSSSSTDCCNLEGVFCESSSSLGLENDPPNSGRVTRLELSGKKLNGRLVESLGNLSQLRILNLSHNFIRYSTPLSLFHLPHLEVLDLSYNDFKGSIPWNISLPSITTLDISSNHLIGPLPTQICKRATSLRVLSFAVNYFNGRFPAGLGSCGSLEQLSLDTNELAGGIAEDVFQLQRLKLLGVEDNRLSGELSTGIMQLHSLERLDISINNFSGVIPDVFHTLSNLRFFIGHSNSFVGGISFSLANSPSIVALNFRNNSLEGSIDLNCSAMTSLTFLGLGSNKFNGSVPDNLPLCMRLQNVNLNRNSFSGPIPESFKNLNSLTSLSLSNNSISNISSSLQVLQQCKNLTTLILTMNFRGEELPSNPRMPFDNLKVLSIANCRLKGKIPSWLICSTKLHVLDLSRNSLSGTIPPWMGNFVNLFYLDVSKNLFSGEIPKTLTGLQSLISRNNALQYNHASSYLPTLDLSYNNLTGFIWREFGNLTKLPCLNLKFNSLSGPIPSEMSGMISLEKLDLSHNNLSGSIPFSLVKLTFLSEFSVAYNNLSGEIPQRGQFSTFPDSSFEGNIHLYRGNHSADPPPRNPDKLTPLEPRRDVSVIVVGTSVGIAYGAAILLLVKIILVLRARTPGENHPIH